ncbi:MAG: DUF3575 domain-containing protein [Muribaculaceae bacterium]
MNCKGDTAQCSIVLRGTASPEGNHIKNKQLAERRIAALEQFVTHRLTLPDVKLVRDSNFIPWEQLSDYVKHSQLKQRDRVVEIVEQNDGNSEATIAAIKNIDNSITWRILKQRYFATLRQASVRFTITQLPRAALPHVADTYPAADSTEILSVATDTITTDTIAVAPLPLADTVSTSEPWTRRLTMKSNAVGLALLIPNLGVELDLMPHLSLSLPVYYSSWNYFTYNVKFRTLSVNPELRAWLRRDNTGLFAAAHAAVAYYNFATAGDYRRQSHSRRTPAVGGGVNVGYRFSLPGHSRWSIEASIGCGVYSVHYDRYRNHYNGLYVDDMKKTWWGIDNAAISIGYTFNLNHRRK